MSEDHGNLATAIQQLIDRLDGERWPRWLSVDAAADYTSLSDKSIRNMVAAGKITPSRAVRGKLLIDRHELDAAITAGCGLRIRKGRGIRR